MNIVFMGTPEFAVKCLQTVNNNHNVVGVFTQPDKPVGRKQILTPPAVKAEALNLGIDVYQPASLKNGEALAILKKLCPDLIVVVAYGKILPTEILNLPKYGCINVHASLLPRHRGASPIQWSIVCGDKQTGVTTMYMDEGMDTGDMLLTSKIDIDATDTAETLHDKLAVLGANLLEKTLKELEQGTLKPIKQPESGVTYAPIIKKEMALINWSDKAQTILNAINGFNPWPCAYFFIEGKRFKVFSAEICEQNGTAGEVIKSDTELIIACEDKSLKLLYVQLEGSKKMLASDLLKGKKIDKGTIIK